MFIITKITQKINKTGQVLSKNIISGKLNITRL